MLARKPISLTTLATAIALFASASVPATASDFLRTQKAQINSHLASLNAAIDHQKIVVAELRTMQLQGHAAPQTVMVAINTLETLQGNRALIQQTADTLQAIGEPSVASQVDAVVLPVPVLKDIRSAVAVSHISFPLKNEHDNELAANIASLLMELREQKATALHAAIDERIQRLAALTHQDAACIREQELLALRRKAYEASTEADTCSLPILSNSACEFSIGGKTVRGEVNLIRLIAHHRTNLQTSTTLNRRRQHAMLWEQRLAVLQQLNLSDSFHKKELNYARSGHEFFSAIADSLESQFREPNVVPTSRVSRLASNFTVIAELQEIFQRQTRRRQQAIDKCSALTVLEESLTHLAKRDSFFASELSATRRSLRVARAEANGHDHAEAVHSAAVAFVESLSDVEGSDVITTNSRSVGEALISMFELAADNATKLEATKARIAVAQARAIGLNALNAEGIASWWETKEADARLEDLITELHRQELIQQINALSLQLVRDRASIWAEEYTVAFAK